MCWGSNKCVSALFQKNIGYRDLPNFTEPIARRCASRRGRLGAAAFLWLPRPLGISLCDAGDPALNPRRALRLCLPHQAPPRRGSSMTDLSYPLRMRSLQAGSIWLRRCRRRHLRLRLRTPPSRPGSYGRWRLHASADRRRQCRSPALTRPSVASACAPGITPSSRTDYIVQDQACSCAAILALARGYGSTLP